MAYANLKLKYLIHKQGNIITILNLDDNFYIF